MANQMIALQARAPQSSGLGSAIAQNAQMINMMRQQEASDRANTLAAQKLAQDQALMGPQVEKAQYEAASAGQKLLSDFFLNAAKILNISQTPEDVRFGADLLKKQYPGELFSHFVDATIRDMPDDPAAFSAWRSKTKFETLDAKEQAPYLWEKLQSKEIIGDNPEGPNVGVLTTGGINRAPTLKVPRTMTPGKAPKGTVTVEPSVTVDANAPVSAADAERFIQSFPPQAQDAIRQRVSEGALGNIPMGSPVPQGLVGGDRGGVGGPYEPVDEGYVEAATPFRAKNPSMSPYPGSAQVPLPRVAAEARAGRESPDEVYAKELARGKAQRELAVNAPPKPLTAQQEQKLRSNMAKDVASAQAIVDNMVNPKIGVIAAVQRLRTLTPNQKEWLVGYTKYLPSITDAGKRADSLWKDLEGKVTQMGKSAASSSGAIGNMAVQEWQIVQRMIADLDLTKMDVKTFDEKLDLIEATAQAAADRARRIYEDQYAEEFARYPGRFQLKVPAAPAANRANPQRKTKTGVDTKNPLLR